MSETTSPDLRTAAGPPAESLPPPRIPGYRIVETIASGGMGIVYRAVQESLGRVVALKMISAGALADENAGRRFRAEAEVVARLRHPSIVPIHEIGIADGCPFFTMDLIEGRSLAALVAEGPLPPRRTAGILVAVARAVAYAHGQGVVHRDLKPGNILLDGGGAPWVTDFGLAKCADRDLGLTTRDAVIGTPSYMAPEQATGSGSEVTFRADVYALGAVLYALLTGRPPHVGGTAMATLRQVVEREPVPPRVLNPGVDRDLETICLAALRKAPERRYAGADAFADDLERWLGARPVAARRPGAVERAGLWVRRRPAVAGLLAVVVIVAALGLGGIVWQWREAVAANADARAARGRQLEAQIEALRVADPAAVGYLIDEILASEADLAPRLREVLADGAASRRERLHAALALLAVDPGVLGQVEALADAASPAELPMIAVEIARRRHLQSEGAWTAFIERRWAQALDQADRRSAMRAAALLAAWAPADPRWSGLRDPLARQLVAEPANLLGTWIELFRPAADAVIPGLLEILRERTASEGELAHAEDLLVEIASGRPDILTRGLLKAREESFRRFLDAAGSASPRLAEDLRQVLSEPAPVRWDDPPLAEAAVPADLAGRLASAHGMLAERWGFVAGVEAPVLEDLDRDLGGAGYRLERLRPFPAPGGPRFLAQWKRDGIAATHRIGLTREEYEAEDARRKAEGSVPEDISAWSAGDPSGLRFAGVWVRTGASDERRAFAGYREADHKAEIHALCTGGFHPWTMTVAEFPDGRRAVSSVWRRRRTEADLLYDYEFPADLLDGGPHPSRILQDLMVSNPEAPPYFAGLWVTDDRHENGIVPMLPLPEHAARAERLAVMGFRPRALAGFQGSVVPGAASTWIRPVPTAEMAEAHSRRRARAAVALATLGDGEVLSRLLEGAYGSSVLIQACRLFEAAPLPAELLAETMDRPRPAERRIGALLALGSEAGGPAVERLRSDMGARIAAIHREDSHAGVHAAAEWALRKLRVPPPDVEAPSRMGEDPGEPTWSRDREGHVLVRFRGPIEFEMGTPGPEDGRKFGEERHRRRIPRSFAIASKEVTAAQFRRFLEDRPEFVPDYPEEVLGAPEDPVGSVTWLHAIQYCRWLSEREDVSPGQLCYPAARAVGQGIRLPPDALNRIGYRLPTEAEWEYAARGGSADIRWCGPDPSLLDSISWWRRNAETGPRPVGSLMPNAYGLFDVIGNAVEWCHGRMTDYPLVVRPQCAVDGGDPEPFGPGDRRVLRGGSFDDLPHMLRSGARRRYDGVARGRVIGFRVARTLE